MRIDVFQDIACPWCRIGKKHLELALEQWDGEVEIYYHPFQLNPDIPAEGYDFKQYMIAKGGGRMQLEDFFTAPRQMGADVGITFNFEQIDRAPNTIPALILTQIVPPDKQLAVTDALFDAYFEHGRDIGDLDELVAIAGEVGVATDGLKEQLTDPANRERLLAQAREASRLGINGVPFYVVNNMLGMSGAQRPETFLQAFQQAEELSLTK